MRSTLAILFLLAAVSALADEFAAHRLFHIERNKNANIVCYDARVLPDGSLPEKDPVVVYWLKLAEGGERKGLKGIERRMAYGFKVEQRDGDRLELTMKADVGRSVFVEAVDDTFRAFIDIAGKRARLDRIYIFADESGIMPKVEYLELFGVDVATGEELYEKYLP
jgi:hypothetical protein